MISYSCNGYGGGGLGCYQSDREKELKNEIDTFIIKCAGSIADKIRDYMRTAMERQSSWAAPHGTRGG